MPSVDVTAMTCALRHRRENGTGGAADDGRLGGQVAAVAAGHGDEEAGYPAGADDRAASGPAFGTTSVRHRPAATGGRRPRSRRRKPAHGAGRRRVRGRLRRSGRAACPAGACDGPGWRSAGMPPESVPPWQRSRRRAPRIRPPARIPPARPVPAGRAAPGSEGQGFGQLGALSGPGSVTIGSGSTARGDLPDPGRGAEPVETQPGGAVTSQASALAMCARRLPASAARCPGRCCRYR